VGFVEDMNSIGPRLKQAQSAYDDAFGKLSVGSGNLVGQAQKLRQLGVKPSKSLAPALVEGAYESDELPFALESDEPASTPKNANGRELGDLTWRVHKGIGAREISRAQQHCGRQVRYLRSLPRGCMYVQPMPFHRGTPSPAGG
jgi:hypothetical protein